MKTRSYPPFRGALRTASRSSLLTRLRRTAVPTRLLTEKPEAAKQIAGPLPVVEGTDMAELAVWVVLGRVILNLDEFISRE